MKIAILTLGTRGDVQPYIALGKALVGRGHQVVLGCPDNFIPWVEEHGLSCVSIGVDMEGFLKSPQARKALAGSPWAMLKLWRGTIVPLIKQSMMAIWDAAHDADLIIDHPKTSAAADVAEATGAALVHSAPFPFFPTGAFPFCVIPGNYGPWLNRLSYRIIIMTRLVFRRHLNRWRTETLGLGKASLAGSKIHRSLNICAASPALVPYGPENIDKVHTTGYWFLEEGEDWQPDQALSAFLAGGETPIYIGFGSMPSKNPARLTFEVLEGVRLSGLRAILAIGWGGLERTKTPDNVHVIPGAPHDALFKLVKAVVHHGGAGTTAAGLKAGRPTLICHSAFDQPFWGSSIHALGLGPKPQALKRLRASRFAAGLVDLTNTESYRIRAREMAQTIAAEDGIAKAVHVIESLAPR
jgi:sterol 3beta-glucosyltransferase